MGKMDPSPEQTWSGQENARHGKPAGGGKQGQPAQRPDQDDGTLNPGELGPAQPGAADP